MLSNTMRGYVVALWIDLLFENWIEIPGPAAVSGALATGTFVFTIDL